MNTPESTGSRVKNTGKHERFTRAVISSSANLLARSRSRENYSHSDDSQSRNNKVRPTLATLKLGDRVQGVFMGQRFQGHLVGIVPLAASQNYHIGIQLNQAIDVVTFESFSNFRRRLNCVVDKDGISTAKTSDDRPHMKLEL